MDILTDILKDSNYSLNLFHPSEIQALKERIVFRELQGVQKPYATCLIRNKEILLKPEEVVRQLYLFKLIHHYNYPKNRIAVEHPVSFGRQTKYADIVVFDKDRFMVEYIIVELKKPKLLDGKNQLRSYCNATGTPIGVWTNGSQISYYNRKDPNYFEDITDIPNANQTLADILQERFTLKDLILKDKIPNEGKSLKSIIQEMEDEVLANAGVDVFEEVFKLIFTKLYDEMKSQKDKEFINRLLASINLSKVAEQPKPGLLILTPGQAEYKVLKGSDFEDIKQAVEKFDDRSFRVLEFRNTGQSEGELETKIQRLFDEAKDKWNGVFTSDSKIDLTPSHLSICVSSLRNVKLFNSNLQIIDEAFEYLVNKSAKGEKGQYFTPRHVGMFQISSKIS